jgi:hypothetical protein
LTRKDDFFGGLVGLALETVERYGTFGAVRDLFDVLCKSFSLVPAVRLIILLTSLVCSTFPRSLNALWATGDQYAKVNITWIFLLHLRQKTVDGPQKIVIFPNG